MAENKKSFVAYCDWGEIFDELEDKDAGKLVKHLFDYVRDKKPSSDKLTQLLFITIQQTLKRDLENWETTRQGRSKAGKASAEARKNKKQQKPTKSTNVKSVQQNQQEPTKSTVSVSVNVSEKIKESKLIEYAIGLKGDRFCEKKLELLAKDAHQHYTLNNWIQKNGNEIKQPKLVFYNNWFKKARDAGDLFPRIGDNLSPILT